MSKNEMLSRLGYLAATGVIIFSLAGCSSAAPEPAASASASSSAQEESNPAADDSAVEAELTRAWEAVTDALASNPEATQVVLTDAVEEVTVAYGAVQVPFESSDVVSKISGTITVTDGAFEISATSAESGQVYTIDQDGVIS